MRIRILKYFKFPMFFIFLNLIFLNIYHTHICIITRIIFSVYCSHCLHSTSHMTKCVVGFIVEQLKDTQCSIHRG